MQEGQRSLSSKVEWKRTDGPDGWRRLLISCI